MLRWELQQLQQCPYYQVKKEHLDATAVVEGIGKVDAQLIALRYPV